MGKDETSYSDSETRPYSTVRKTASDIEALVRPHIRELEPYRSAREDFGSGILLDANENSFGSVVESGEQLHRYPPPRHPKLRRGIARWRGVKKENVFLGVGSDEPIDLLLRIFCEPGRDRIMIAPPTYGMYAVTARIHNVETDRVVMDEAFQPRTGAMRQAWSPHSRLLFLCSPNNPTGNELDPEKIEELLEAFPGVVVLDEAYIDFSESPSHVPMVLKHPNLVVLQTFSKSFGLAGARVGMAFAPENVVRYLMKIKSPYNLSGPAAARAEMALGRLDQMEEKIVAIRSERDRLKRLLGELPCVEHVFVSRTNFLLVRFEDAMRSYRHLAENGVIVRYRGDEPRCGECLRITVGRPEENDRLIEILKTNPS